MLHAVAGNGKEQLNLYVDPAIKSRLNELAKSFYGKSAKGTRVAAEIIELYIESWARLEAHRRELVDNEGRRLIDILDKEMGRKRPPLVKEVSTPIGKQKVK